MIQNILIMVHCPTYWLYLLILNTKCKKKFSETSNIWKESPDFLKMSILLNWFIHDRCHPTNLWFLTVKSEIRLQRIVVYALRVGTFKSLYKPNQLPTSYPLITRMLIIFYGKPRREVLYSLMLHATSCLQLRLKNCKAWSMSTVIHGSIVVVHSI